MPIFSLVLNMKPLREGVSEGKRLFQDLTKEANNTSSAISRIRKSAGGIKAAIAGSGFVLFAKQCFEAALQVDKLNKAFTTIKGNGSAAEEQLDHIRSVTDKLGLQFHETA